MNARADSRVPAFLALSEPDPALSYHEKRLMLLRRIHAAEERVGVLDATWAGSRAAAVAEAEELQRELAALDGDAAAAGHTRFRRQGGHGWPVFLLVLFLLVLAFASEARAADIPPAEIAWQAIHAVDVLETVQGPARGGYCYAEGDFITQRVIGQKPSVAGVVAWGAGLAVAHWYVQDWLREHGHTGLAHAFEFVTITSAGIAITNNARIGIHPGGADKCVP